MGAELNKQIGARIRLQRENLHYSREDLAEKIEISSRFLADIELGTKGMSFQTLIRLSNELHVSTDYILLGKENNHTKTELLSEIIQSIDEEYLPELETIICAYTKAINKEKNLRSK